jgi:hypothetical protein
MAIGRISGSVLKSNLTRNGTDLAFETNLLYLDVTNSRIGIGTSEPSQQLHVNGTTLTTDLTVSGDATVRGTIFADRIQSSGSNADIVLAPQGTGQVVLNSIKSDDSSAIRINDGLSMAGSIIPAADNTYDLGSATSQWRDIYVSAGSLYINNKPVLQEVDGDTTVSTDTDENLIIKTIGTGITTIQSASQVAITTTGSGDVTLTTSSGNIELKGTVEILSGKKIIDSAGTNVEFSDAIHMNNNRITNVGDPVSSQDVATKAYVDSNTSGITNLFSVVGDDSTGTSFNFSETFKIAGGTNITTAVSGDTVTITGPDLSSYITASSTDTLTNKTINGSQLVDGSVANAKLTNSTITVSDGSSSTATALGGTITFSGTANEVEVAESSGTITIGLPNDVTVGNNLTVTGDLTVNGTTTTVNSTTLTVDDKNIELGSVTSPSDTTADGGGITLKGATDKTFNWIDSTDSWTSSEHIDLATGKEFKINNSTVLTSSQVLGKSLPAGDVVGSSDTQTLTNKTINSASNTITITESNISDLGAYITASSTDTLTNKTFDANGTGNSISNIEVVDFASGVVDTDLSSVSASDDTLASAKAIKAYVDQISTSAISEGNSSVAVSDSGTGSVTVTADGNTELVINDTNATFSGPVVIKDRNTIVLNDTDNSNYIALRAPSSVTANNTYTFPNGYGTSGQVLSTDGAGALSWADAGGGGGGGGSSYPNSTITTPPGTSDNYDLAEGPAQDGDETPFEAGGTDAFGVNLGSVFDAMDPIGSTASLDYGDGEAYVGA